MSNNTALPSEFIPHTPQDLLQTLHDVIGVFFKLSAKKDMTISSLDIGKRSCGEWGTTSCGNVASTEKYWEIMTFTEFYYGRSVLGGPLGSTGCTQLAWFATNHDIVI